MKLSNEATLSLSNEDFNLLVAGALAKCILDYNHRHVVVADVDWAEDNWNIVFTIDDEKEEE